jgi:hypothetical protein
MIGLARACDIKNFSRACFAILPTPTFGRPSNFAALQHHRDLGHRHQESDCGLGRTNGYILPSYEISA